MLPTALPQEGFRRHQVGVDRPQCRDVRPEPLVVQPLAQLRQVGIKPEWSYHECSSFAPLSVLHLSREHLFDRSNDETRLVELDVVAAAGGNDVDAVRGETR